MSLHIYEWPMLHVGCLISFSFSKACVFFFFFCFLPEIAKRQKNSTHFSHVGNGSQAMYRNSLWLSTHSLKLHACYWEEMALKKRDWIILLRQLACVCGPSLCFSSLGVHVPWVSEAVIHIFLHSSNVVLIFGPYVYVAAKFTAQHTP